ncbi:hypothetical protein ACKGJO_06965 [Gracilimonas sp. Q87]|uniref:hypothetical protein n=1 Tax=Gracilimonas sp. Q87 TaxID=3384766 RepID=UPI003984398A
MSQIQSISEELAKELMDEFSEGTGLRSDSEMKQKRYLWTDALALQNFLALASLYDEKEYEETIRELINKVHHTLGKFDQNDSRSGWISDLPEEEAQKHPTVKGLRIGKPQPERKQSEPFNDRKEWDRDGQYYHYHTRWIHALLQASENLDIKEWKQHAVELSLAGRHFLQKTDGRFHLYWKMSVDLSYPQVPTMGAHDPLEGYLTALECEMLSSAKYDFTEYLQKLEKICEGQNWSTTDPLGLGGLLLNIVRSAELSRYMILPESVKPKKLFKEAMSGLDTISNKLKVTDPAEYRLAFRECGLSMGLRALDHHRDLLIENDLKLNKLEENLGLAEDIESFWGQPENRKYSSYQDHLHINNVSLASSLLAELKPEFYSTTVLG